MALISIVMTVLVASQVFGQDCPFPCTQGGQQYCNHIPCPLPPCGYPVLTPGECCPHCPTTQADAIDCPHPCTQGGQHYCHPIPCPLPPCVDHKTDPGICCPSCPNGPNCPAPEGHVVALHQSEIIDGKNCTCIHPMMETTCV